MPARLRLYVLLALLGGVSSRASVLGLPPCGTPGTITTLTAPDGDYLAAFSDYTIYPPEPLAVGPEGDVYDLVAAPDYRSYYPQELALDPQGRVYVADQTIIYRLEADGTATRIVGVPQYSFLASESDAETWRSPLLQRFNVLEDTVAALDARIGPGAMAFDEQGRLYFVDYINSVWSGGKRSKVRIARLEADGQVVTFAGTGEIGSSGDGGPAREAQFGVIGSLVFDREGNLLVAGTGGIRRIDGQGIVSTLLEADSVRELIMDGQGVLYFSMGHQVFRRLADGVIEHVAGSGVDSDRTIGEEFEGGWRYYFSADGQPATEASLDLPAGLAIDEQGSLYIANYYFNRIHRVRPDGILETIAGNGLDSRYLRGCEAPGKRVAAGKRLSGHRCQDHIGDGGPALEATIWRPWFMLFTHESDLLVTMLHGGYTWEGGAFSHLRRICGVSEWMVPTAVEAVAEVSAVSVSEGALPSLRLYPNPFNAAITLAFDLEHSASVSVRIYNELGQQVQELAAEALRPSGHYQFVWNGRDEAGQFQASGTYLLVLSVDGAIESHKLTLLH